MAWIFRNNFHSLIKKNAFEYFAKLTSLPRDKEYFPSFSNIHIYVNFLQNFCYYISAFYILLTPNKEPQTYISV